MKKASKFEKFAARCWNLLNEGKPFTPIFTTGVMLLFTITKWDDPGFWPAFGTGFLLTLPFLVLYFIYDFPLFLRNYLYFPIIGLLLLGYEANMLLWLLAAGVYFFFTVFFWGTIYYYLRIGTTLLNFTRFWKLVLKNSDSTSGNAQEQLPKVLLLLTIWHQPLSGTTIEQNFVMELGLFFTGLLLYTLVLHRYLFDWKPVMYTNKTSNTAIPAKAVSDRVIVIVIDGMRKDRFEAADTPFLDKLRKEGTEYTQMETVYPARTVVCFSSMFTGTYPEDHGITSNMVYRLGIRTESIFDSLRKVNKKGRLLGIAHLVDAMGDDVETVTAVMHNDEADPNIMKRAKKIMLEQDPDFFAVQLIATDQTGHSRGVLYDEYLQKIAEADALVEDFVSFLEENNMMENTTLVICADHGQADGIGGHGHLDEGERFVPFIMHGPHIKQGLRIDEKQSLVSLAPTISYLMAAPYPSHSRGPVLTGALKDSQKSSEGARTENEHPNSKSHRISSRI
ncbi:alkaline phosphatase family protein [Fictibacillus iocasae]|uniref:Alkaline phosphatase family protein n=1 Tax=Fictibacillus iocasae TaxID=2715437 RepID=A0ABW2NND8_9BACL